MTQMATDTARQPFLFKELTSGIIGAGFAVHNALGCGLLEKVYENALAWELERTGMRVQTQREYPVIYRDKTVGTYCADLVVEDKVIVETKAAERLDDVHRAQVMAYLKVSGLRVGLLMNFGRPRLEFERFIV